MAIPHWCIFARLPYWFSNCTIRSWQLIFFDYICRNEISPIDFSVGAPRCFVKPSKKGGMNALLGGMFRQELNQTNQRETMWPVVNHVFFVVSLHQKNTSNIENTWQQPNLIAIICSSWGPTGVCFWSVPPKETPNVQIHWRNQCIAQEIDPSTTKQSVSNVGRSRKQRDFVGRSGAKTREFVPMSHTVFER